MESLLQPIRSGRYLRGDGTILGRPAEGGFAVILALSLLSFVLLLLLGLSVFVGVETASSSLGKVQTAARQNALLGMQLALGQLQGELGPDERISASAAQLDTDPLTQEVEGVAQPNWTGVWRSAPRAANAAPVVGDPDAGRPDAFQAWLVSGVDVDPSDAGAGLDQARGFAAADPRAVQLVGPGSLGAGDAPAARVSVPRVDLDSVGFQRGGFAYWVGDEGQKAHLAAGPARSQADDVEAIQGLVAPKGPSMALVDGWDAFDRDALTARPVIGRGTMENILDVALDSADWVDPHFHSITSYARGLMTNVVEGGWRRDLSLLFSGSDLPVAYQDQPLFEYGDARGPGWDYLKRFHDRYLQMTPDDAGLPVLNTLSIRDETAVPEPPDLKGDVPLPVVARFQYLFSLYRGHNTMDGLPYPGSDPRFDPDYQSADQIVYLMITPIVYWWNPYNIAVEMPSTADGQGAMGLLPGIPPIEMSFDDGGSYLPVWQMFWVFAGELFAMNSSNVPSGEGLTIPPGGMVINSLRPLTYSEKLAVFPVDLRGDAYVDPGTGDVITGATGCFGALLRDHHGEFGSFERVQAMAEGFRESDLGFFTPLVQPMPPGGERRDMKLLATGSARLRLRFDPVQTWYVFKNHAGAGRTPSGPFADRDASGVMNFRSPGPIESSFIPTEYVHEEVISLASLQPLVDAGGNFTGLSPRFALNYDLRAFEEDSTLGQPGVFSDPSNLHFFSETSDERAFAMAPFRFYFEAVSENPVQNNPLTGEPAFRTEAGDLVFRNTAKELLSLPPLSLMQLSHAPLGRDYQHHAYQFSGEAALLSDNAMWNRSPGDPDYRNMSTVVSRAFGNSFAHPDLPYTSIGDGAFAVDRAYLLNEALFDSTFFSGLAEPGGVLLASGADDGRPLEDRLRSFLAGDYLLPNESYRLSLPESLEPDAIEDALAEGAEGRERVIASLIEVDGAFNVNSTSVDAWSAMLASLRDTVVPFLDYDSGEIADHEDPSRTPVMLTSLPAEASLESVDRNPSDLFRESWSRYRTLADSEIRSLAEALVREVKARGPFLSLAQFVNREVSNRDQYNRSGPVQTAIDSARLNTNSEDAIMETVLQKRFDSNPNATAALNAAGFAEPGALEGDVNAGLAGYLTQADILRPLMPRLSARSDTFTIRAYGDVVEDGRTVARAWCEAVVQRRAEYVEGSGVRTEPWEAPARAIEQRFGRGFEILEFRWLDEEDV